MKDWQKTEGSPIWNYANAVFMRDWDYESEEELLRSTAPSLEGIYLSMEANLRPDGSNRYNFRQPDGLVLGVWGNTILDDAFQGISIGEVVWLVYLGVKKNEETGEKYHNFEVYHRSFR